MKKLLDMIGKVFGQPTQEQRDRAYKDAIGEGEISPSPRRQMMSEAEKEALRSKFKASPKDVMDKADAEKRETAKKSKPLAR